MFVFVPQRYQTPKWQAPVIPKSHAFRFSDGLEIFNLYGLKQALNALPDNELQAHVFDHTNHLADWVESCVGDLELAQALRSQPHRWGMIVALERHMMRTLNLPDYVASRWLSSVEPPFTFVSGQTVHSLAEMATVLTQVSDDTIDFHLERYPNDLAVWVIENIGDHEAADLLNECSNRTQMHNYLTDHLEMLKDAADLT